MQPRSRAPARAGNVIAWTTNANQPAAGGSPRSSPPVPRPCSRSASSAPARPCSGPTAKATATATSPPTRSASAPAATRSRPRTSTSTLDGPESMLDDGALGKLRVRAESNDGKPVFVGIARTSDVEDYLRGTAHDVVTDVEYDPFDADYDARRGDREPAAPARQDIWAASAHGAGERALTWDVDDGDWSVVVMNEDGSRGVDAGVSAGVRLGWLDEAGFVSLGDRRPAAADRRRRCSRSASAVSGRTSRSRSRRARSRAARRRPRAPATSRARAGAARCGRRSRPCSAARSCCARSP